MRIVEDKERESVLTVEYAGQEEKNRLLDFVKYYDSKIYVQRNGREYIVSMEDIYYIESLEKSTIIYTKDESYQSKMWLYQLEENLSINFVRINKSTIINLLYIQNMKSDIGARIRLELASGDRFIVTRAYNKEFKRKLGVN